MTTSRWKRSRAVRLAMVGLVATAVPAFGIAAPRISASAGRKAAAR